MPDESGKKSKLKFPLPWVMLSHEDVRAVGIPDKTLTGAGSTSWWEFKDKGLFPHLWSARSRGVQLRTCRLLARAGRCRYVAWHAGLATIATPDEVAAAIAERREIRGEWTGPEQQLTAAMAAFHRGKKYP